MGSTRAKSSFLKWLSRVALFSAKVSFRRTSNTLLHKKEKLNRRTQLTAPTTKATVRKRKMQKNISLVILAVDSYRGLFYDFHWDAHRKSVLSLTNPPTVADRVEEGTSWGSGTPWNVEIKESKRDSGAGRKQKLEEEFES